VFFIKKEGVSNMDLKKKGDKTNNSTYTRIDKNILNEVRKFAKDNNYSILDIVNLALNEFLNKNNKK